MHTFVAFDTEKDDKVVAFVRWREPQADLNLDELWPDLPGGADLDILGPFFGGTKILKSNYLLSLISTRHA